MNPFQFLKSPWPILGLEAPVLSWLAGLGVVLYTAFHLIALRLKVVSLVREYNAATTAVEKLRRNNPTRAAEGLPFQVYDSLSQALAEYPALGRAWQRFQSQKVIRRRSCSRIAIQAVETTESVGFFKRHYEDFCTGVDTLPENLNRKR